MLDRFLGGRREGINRIRIDVKDKSQRKTTAKAWRKSGHMTY
jgi:hypothetical protein